MEGSERAVEMVAAMSRRDLGADARLALWNHRIREAYHIDALIEQLRRHGRGQGGIAQHHRDDRMFAGNQGEAKVFEAGAEIAAVIMQGAAQIAARRIATRGQQIERPDCGAGNGRRQAV